jgi:hypothetical protein
MIACCFSHASDNRLSNLELIDHDEIRDHPFGQGDADAKVCSTNYHRYRMVKQCTGASAYASQK